MPMFITSVGHYKSISRLPIQEEKFHLWKERKEKERKKKGRKGGTQNELSRRVARSK